MDQHGRLPLFSGGGAATGCLASGATLPGRVRAERVDAAQAAELLSRLRQLLWRGQVEGALAVVRAELNGQAGAELARELDH